MKKSEKCRTVNRKAVQIEASKYLIGICDVCARSQPDAECEDYSPADIKQSPMCIAMDTGSGWRCRN